MSDELVSYPESVVRGWRRERENLVVRIEDLTARLAAQEATIKELTERIAALLGALAPLVTDEDDDHAGVYWDGEEGIDDWVCAYCGTFPHTPKCPILSARALLADPPKGSPP